MALNRADERTEAAEAWRMRIERSVPTPGRQRGEIFVALHGELRTILERAERPAIFVRQPTHDMLGHNSFIRRADRMGVP